MPVARDVAQLVVRSLHKRKVVGSKPIVTTTRLTGCDFVSAKHKCKSSILFRVSNRMCINNVVESV